METIFIFATALGGPLLMRGPKQNSPLMHIHVHVVFLSLNLINLFLLFSADLFYQTLYLLFCGLLIIAFSIFLYKNGPDFVDYPKLV